MTNAAEMRLRDRDAALRRLVTEERVDALLIVSPANLAYVSGFRVTPLERLVLLVVTADGALRLVVPALEEASAREALPEDAEIYVWSDEDGPGRAIETALASLPAVPSIGIEKPALTVASFELIASVLRRPSFVDCGRALARLRLVKSEDEIACIRRAAEIIDRAIGRFTADEIRPGRTEVELSDAIGRIIREEGGDGLAFPPLVQVGEHSAHPHGSPGARRIEEGELLLVDAGAGYGGYCSDITRTLVPGRASERQRELFDLVDRARAAGVAACGPGVRAADVDAAARGVIAAAGLGDAFIHRTGHGLGLEIHEGPQVSATSEDVLAEGMVLTVEPGVYLPGYGGVRLEDDVLITGSGRELLTRAPICLEVPTSHAAP